MSLWRQLSRGFRALTSRSAADRDVADEVENYLEQATAELIAGGMSPEEARRAAQLQLGSSMALREEVRSYGWENRVESLLTDLRYAARRLRKSPGFTVVAALTLALGMGASTAIFSAVYPILFQPLPYPDPGRILMIWDSNQGARANVTFHTYREVALRNHSFETIAAADAPLWQPSIAGQASLPAAGERPQAALPAQAGGEPERLDGQRVTSEYFRVLGVGPAMGRDFQASDDRLNGPKVVILSDALWHRRFGGDPAIVGQQITLDGDLWTVIGVMPRSFENVVAPLVRIWRPMQFDTENASNFNTREWGHHVEMVGRLRPGVSPGLARRDLNEMARSPLAQFPRPPWASLKFGFIANALQPEITHDVRPVLLAILGAVVLVLLIACVNVTNLLLARGAQRRGELAMRAALGAPRSRLVQQLLTESLLLAIIGGALGVVVAVFAVRALVALAPVDLPRAGAIAVSGAVFVFALGITTLVGLAVGLVPAFHAGRDDVQTGLRQSSRQTVGGHQMTRRTLVVAEVALAVVLLVGAGLLLRSLERLFAVDVGFRATQLLTMQVQETGPRYRSGTARNQFFVRALEAVERVPGVTAAAFTSQLPLSGDSDGYGVEFENEYNPQDAGSVFRYSVSPGYFQTMGIPLRRGRFLGDHDATGAPVAVVISESLAKRKFPGRDPIGSGLRIGPGMGNAKEPWAIIVGVVGNVRQTALGVGDADAVYTTPLQWYWVDNPMSLVIRSSGLPAQAGDVAALAPSIRRAIWSVDKDQPIVRVATMETLVARSEGQRRFALVIFETFALVALVLAATGIYGVLSGSVNERTREMGVRAALGATRASIVGLVARQGLALTGLGAVFGLAGAMLASQALVTLLFGISSLDPATYIGGIALLAAVAVVACWVPAWRAARVDPAITLRAE